MSKELKEEQKKDEGDLEGMQREEGRATKRGIVNDSALEQGREQRHGLADGAGTEIANLA